jgi:FKBP-type peptidyl-prolyl cis-trans isomerase SlyD
MKIENNKFASLSYTLHECYREGRVIRNSGRISSPSFVFGAGRLLPAFEANLEGLEEGAAFDFSLEHQRPMVRYVRR